jgi:CubicO group peptidase (beta-lactamase class C family)
MTADIGARGFVAAGFEPVAREFERNFSDRGEVGAAFAAVRDDCLIADLWGGWADRQAQRAWSQDTLQLIFSGTKGLVAACLLMLIDRGQLDLDAAVCRYWPQFAAAGKSRVLVRDVVTHTACLPGLAIPVTSSEILDGRRMAELLAAQPQLGDPRAARTYHPLTYGWLCGELIRRADGRSVGRFLSEEIASPLNLDLFIGLPSGLEPRVSRLELATTWGTSAVFDPRVAARDAFVHTVWGNPPAWAPGSFPWNDPLFHQAEIPGANGIGTARAIATFYGALARLISPGTLRLGVTELEFRYEPLLGSPQSFGVGFALQTELNAFGPPACAFGHGGAGGSVHGAWLAERVGFSYAMNLMRDDQQDGDPRSKALLGALHDCLRGAAPAREEGPQ